MARWTEADLDRTREATAGELASVVAELMTEPTHVKDQVIQTGLEVLDDVVGGGLRAGTLTVVAGAPGVGTSMFATGVATRAAVRHSLPTLVMAPDMDRREVQLRIISAATAVPMTQLRMGRLGRSDLQRLEEHRAQLERAPLIISAGWLRPAEQPLAECIDTYARTGPLDLVVADRLPDSRHGIRALKVAAQQHDLAVLVTARACLRQEARDAPRPRLVDLQHRDALAEHADVVIGLHRLDLDDKESNRAGEADLEIFKNRFGPTRRLPPLAFQGHYARFTNLATNNWTRHPLPQPH